MKKLLLPAAGLLPGFLVCLGISAISQYIAGYLPVIGAALFAILIGIVCGNTFLNRETFAAGTKFSESRLLEYSIVLTGLTLQISDIAGVGLSGILFITVQMAVTIAGTYLIGKRLGFGKKFSLLMSAGNAVCGSSAIGTVSPILAADSKDKGISITIVNVTGTVLMVVLPVIAAVLYHEETVRTSGLIGGTLQSIGQVIASAKFVNEDVVQMATIFKIIRIVFLVCVAYLFGRMDLSEGTRLFGGRKTAGGSADAAGGSAGSAGDSAGTAGCMAGAAGTAGIPAAAPSRRRISCGIPWFILGFFLLSLVTTAGLIPGPLSHTAKLVSSQFEIIALAAIGMRVKFHDLIKEGPKALLYGGCVGALQIVCAVILIGRLL